MHAWQLAHPCVTTVPIIFNHSFGIAIQVFD
jgi:hypothetical protein